MTTLKIQDSEIGKIITCEYIHPPIPCRCFDWSAYIDPESTLVGYGETPHQAMRALKEEMVQHG